MLRGDFISSHRADRFGGRWGAWAVASAVPVAVLAAAALTGVGLARQIPGAAALLAGWLLTLLPALGLMWLFRGGAGLLATAVWSWSLAVLLCLPLYFPGERAEATARGVRFMAAPLGAGGSDVLSRLAGELLGLLGSEPERLPEARRLPDDEGVEMEEPGEGGRQGVREASGSGALARLEVEEPPTERVVVLPYEGDGRIMRVSAFFDGPVYGEEFPMIFDTGATFTTLNREALAALEVEVPPDAPTVVLHTAAGEATAQLVLVDAAWLGEEMVDWVTVAVCEPCAGAGAAGLLGLNVTGQFEVALRHDRKQIELRRAPGRENRKVDIGQWLEIEARVRRWRDGRVQVELKGWNRSPADIGQALVEVKCGDSRFAVELEHIPARATATTRKSLPHDTDCTGYRIDLLRGTWEHPGF